MISLNQPPVPPKAAHLSRRQRRVVTVLAALGLLALFLVAERIRGQRRLAVVKQDLVNRGQVADIRQLLPKAPANYHEFTNRFVRASHHSVGPDWLFAQHQVEISPGKAAVGSQAPYPAGNFDPQPLLTNGVASPVSTSTNTWENYGQRYASNRTALVELYDLMRNPPAARGDDYLARLRGSDLPNFSSVREAAQKLDAALVWELHQGDFPAAEATLTALAGSLRLYREDPTFVGQMIRSAVEGLGAESSVWGAVQTDGWSDGQLERIQKAWQSPPVWPEVIAALHFERLAKLEYYDHFRSSTYREWCETYRKLFSSFNARVRPLPPLVESGREYVFHPLWKFAWADQEMAGYLERSDFLTTLPKRALEEKTAVFDLVRGLDGQHAIRRPHFWNCRFYLSLPYVDLLSEVVGTPRPEQSPISWREHLDTILNGDFRIPSFNRAILIAAHNDVLCTMAGTSIALKRHQLRHGRLPDNLSALVPAFLPEVPIDLMDGKPLRYRLNSTGTYTLYSIGINGRDDGGDSNPETSGNRFDKRDLVWLAAVPWKK